MAESPRLAGSAAGSLLKSPMMSASMPHHTSFLPSTSSHTHSTNQHLVPSANHPYAFDPSSLQAPVEQQSVPRTSSCCMTAPHGYTTNSYSTTTRDFAFRPDSTLASATHTHDWATYQTSMGPPVSAHTQGLERAGPSHHATTDSTLSVQIQGSPFANSTPYPRITKTEFGSGYPVDAKNILLSNYNGHAYYPSQSAHTPATHQPVRAYVQDYSTGDDIPPDFVRSARHSMSSYSNDSPATPPSVPAENMENYGNNDAKKSTGHIQLFRTESQAYQDELYNPPTTYSTTPAVAKPTTYLSPHRNVISERIQTANLARSKSPASSTTRERSPFRDHSPLAPTGDWRTPGAVGTAASLRQQQKEQAAQAEYARNMPPLHREPTETISPKDALLDYNDQDQPTLFQESIPQGYKQHNTGTGTDPWPTNGYIGQPGASFGTLQASQGPANFATSTAFNFDSVPSTASFNPSGIPAQTFPMNTCTTNKPNSYLTVDAHPQFPATLTSMESSMSDNPPSSGEVLESTSVPRRPDDTRANTGAYTCTYHGCTRRFDTPSNLQKHKREYHRAQAYQQQQQRQQREASVPSSHRSTSSPARSTISPAPSGSGMTSAALQARNSQAGPHKCTRINPSTGKPCNTIFSRPYDLTRHEDTIHNGRKQKVRCPMCREEKTFSRNDALTRHMRVVHPEVENFGKRSRRE